MLERSSSRFLPAFVSSLLAVSTLLTDYAAAGITNSLVLHAPLDASTITGTAHGGVISNVVSTTYHGTVVDDGLTGVLSNPTGLIGEALRSDNSVAHADANAHVDFGDFGDPGSGSFTVAAWVKFDDLQSTHVILSKGAESSGERGWLIYLGTATLYVRVNDGTHRQEGIAFPGDTAWHHVALVIDRDTDEFTGYLDGSAVGWSDSVAGPDLAPGSSITAENGEPLGLGIRCNDPGNDRDLPMDGDLDDVGMWTRALTADEIETIYRVGLSGLDLTHTGDGLVFHASLDTSDITGTGHGDTIYDLADDAQNGTVVDPGWAGTFSGTAGQIGEALYLNNDAPDGSENAHVDFANRFDPGVGSFTVALWVNPDQTNGAQVVLGKGAGSSVWNGWLMWISENKMRVRVHVDASTQREEEIALPDANWHHVALVIDRSTDEIRGYLDGSNSGWTDSVAGADLSAGSRIMSDANMELGTRFTNPAHNLPLDGKVDDVGIWLKALSDEEIMRVYTLGLSGESLAKLAGVRRGTMVSIQ